ncbi:substrate-binding domain-containing protein [Streptomyces sp. NPDC048187]|uniref:substrate-binding domain-containing protein n=1 Tax=Streptomyces sp. NPDC048187 TaxID=3365509 RepID=UPI00370FDA95
MAEGACQFLREQGKRTPRDVTLIGFDDSSVAVTCRPVLTTERQLISQLPHVHGAGFGHPRHGTPAPRSPPADRTFV